MMSLGEGLIRYKTQEDRGKMSMDMMTVEEVAAKLKLKKSWIYANADRLGAYRLGKYLRFFWPRVLECLERMGGGPLNRLPNNSKQMLQPAGGCNLLADPNQEQER
jgi:hypothetical protein